MAKGPGEVGEARTCYVCKGQYRRIHFFYDQLCPECADLNWRKRNQSADLSGRTALVTGARVKIGYEASIKLLRAGARVIATTRFPRDAALRYAREADFPKWRANLQIFGLDLRHTPSIEAFAAHLLATEDRLDFLLNNACQTVRRPPAYYAHMMEVESKALEECPREARALLDSFESFRSHREDAQRSPAHPGRTTLRAIGIHESAALSQIELVDDDRSCAERLFPSGNLDQDLQQVDLRGRNSWRLALDEVSAVELLEVHLVNAVAPFILNARLKELMKRRPSRDQHIVNVSAMEGQFYRAHKTDKHPHTNMAKASLNMMTRTSAIDYLNDGIHMNSVDTGWITDEDPIEIAARKEQQHDFHPPLDVVDAAARICDPIFDGLLSGRHAFGQFFKDYRPTHW